MDNELCYIAWRGGTVTSITELDEKVEVFDIAMTKL